MKTLYKVVDIITNEVLASFDNYFDARDFSNARGDVAIDLVDVDEDGFEIEDFDYDFDFGYEPCIENFANIY